MTTTKSITTKFKLSTDDTGEPTGEVEFYAAKFGNVDLVGDRMVKGSFQKSLDAWKSSGAPIPIVFSHKWDDPFSLIGYANPSDVKEDDQGLLVKGTLDIGDNPTAKQVWKNMQRKTLNEASFAYDVKSESGLKKGRDGANDIYEVDLLEVGPTLKGANPETVGVLSAKARAAADGSKGTNIAGSVEATQAAILDALSDKTGSDDDSDAYSYIFATFPDRAIVASWNGGGSETEYNSYPYTIGPDGTATLGDPTPVEIETTVTAAPSKDGQPGGTKASSGSAGDDDRAQTLFDLSDKAHTAIAVAIVFGAADERNGKPKPQSEWSYRGGNPGADLTAAEISTVVSRVRAAASKFDVPLTAPSDDDSKSSGEHGTKAGARHSAADAKRVQDIHDTTCALGASCDDTDASKSRAKDSTSGVANEQPNDGVDASVANGLTLIGTNAAGDSLYAPQSVLSQISTVTADHQDTDDGDTDQNVDGDDVDPSETSKSRTKDDSDDTEDSQSSGDEGDSEDDEESDSDSKSIGYSLDLLELEQYTL
jgi:HK97 family phage prohead protease